MSIGHRTPTAFVVTAGAHDAHSHRHQLNVSQGPTQSPLRQPRAVAFLRKPLLIVRPSVALHTHLGMFLTSVQYTNSLFWLPAPAALMSASRVNWSAPLRSPVASIVASGT